MRRENEALRRRVRELERTLSSRRQSESGIRPNDLVSTAGSTRPPAGGSAPVDGEDDSVNVGESAASAGVGGGH